ncbi:MAG TPA: histidine kinase [Opitutaceae bacterium]|nr:histidine kinase [Opitutaceae bacterium]
MEATAATSHSLLLEDTARRTRGKQRLYVICQLCGWLFFLGLHVTLFVMDPGKDPYMIQLRIFNTSLIAIMVLVGLLMTHYLRPLFARWGWKNLGWRALVPRIFGMTLVQSTLLVAVVFAYPFFFLQYPWPAKHSIWLSVALTWVNDIVLFGVWFCVYFFYHLFERFNRSELERAQLAASAKEAELRSLKSQVNPHFIFNSLNSLRALIDEDPARARQSVTQLANLLRYSLQSGQLETVPFEDELRVVNDYLALEQVRHEERLRVRLDISPDTLQLPIPPMLLQTLVENAVKYGISTQREGGEIAIVARQEGGALRLQVTNPGSLPEAVRRAKASASTGVGLKNASDRLRLLFGEKATLNLRSATPDSVVAEAVIPLRIA